MAEAPRRPKKKFSEQARQRRKKKDAAEQGTGQPKSRERVPGRLVLYQASRVCCVRGRGDVLSPCYKTIIRNIDFETIILEYTKHRVLL